MHREPNAHRELGAVNRFATHAVPVRKVAALEWHPRHVSSQSSRVHKQRAQSLERAHSFKATGLICVVTECLAEASNILMSENADADGLHLWPLRSQHFLSMDLIEGYASIDIADQRSV